MWKAAKETTWGKGGGNRSLRETLPQLTVPPVRRPVWEVVS